MGDEEEEVTKEEKEFVEAPFFSDDISDIDDFGEYDPEDFS